jgi:aspartyl-tRNA(Asn)/glutamyl-tRNA(Gln) amidotransferase subunit A
MTEPYQWSVTDTAQYLAARRVSSREVLHALRARIAQPDASLRAWVRLADEFAEAEAAACDEETARGISRGPLHGVPIAIKDNLDVVGMPTRGGSDLTNDLPATSNAAAVKRLRAAGAVVLGKTAMTAFAAMDPAKTRNPWNGAHTPGGSSSGSAAAVAAQMCGAALGTQTAGSVLRPAAYCGVVGLKPTYGAVSREGLIPCAWSMDHVGAIARDVHDIELMFGALASQAPRTGDGDSGPVVGIPIRGFDIADADAALAFHRAIDVLAVAGAKVISIVLPDGFETLSAAGIVTMYAEMAAFHRELFSRRSAQYPPRLRVLVEAGLKLSASDYLDAQRIRHLETAQLSSLLEGVDRHSDPNDGNTRAAWSSQHRRLALQSAVQRLWPSRHHAALRRDDRRAASRHAGGRGPWPRRSPVRVRPAVSATFGLARATRDVNEHGKSLDGNWLDRRSRYRRHLHRRCHGSPEICCDDTLQMPDHT